MRLKFWGTSDAQGVPRMMCNCSVCISKSRYNMRTRPSLYIDFDYRKEDTALVDVGPDFRNQFLDHADRRIPEHIFITHAHNDHIAGMGDLADLCFWQDADCKIIAPLEVIEIIISRFPYLKSKKGLSFIPAEKYYIANYEISFNKMNHGFNGYSYGIIFNNNNNFIWGYYPDTFQLSQEQLNTMKYLDLLILGTSYWKEEAPPTQRSVYDVHEGLKIKSKLDIKKMILTHLSHDIDFKMNEDLPEGVSLAYDGLEFEL